MDRESRATTRIETVIDHVRQRIAGRQLAAGARLPSVRAMARSLALSVSTVVEAYDRLVSEGLIVARQGSGFYVASRNTAFAVSDVGPRLDRAVDPFWVSRQALEADPASLKPGCGWLPAEWLPETAVRRALRQLSRAEPRALCDYGHPLGHAGLRQLIARRGAERDIALTPDQILITDSGTQAIDLVCRMLLSPGDTVLVDDPCYFNFHALLKAHRATVVGVRYTPSGPDVAHFAEVAAAHRPKLYITNAGIHNPTGATLSAATAHRILKLADAFDLTIIEDDIFADFEHRPAPRLAAFDGLARVVHIGSFSKTLSASMRCGFIAARPDWIEDLTNLSIATTFAGGRMNAELVCQALGDPAYRKHTEALRQRLARARAEGARRLEALGLSLWTEPDAGLFLWCTLPDGHDAADLARRALKEGIVLAPGNAFSVSQGASGFMRFNVAQMEDRRFDAVLRRLIASSPGRA